MAALSDLTFTFVPSRQWQASAARTGSDYASVTNQGSISTPVVTVSKSIANATAGGGDSLASFIQSVPAAGTATIDLQALTDVLERSSHSFARLKYVEFRLLSVEDDATNGTACSGVTIGDAGSNPNKLFFTAAADMTCDLGNSDFIIWGTKRAAGNTVGGSTKNVLITNNDGAVAAKVQVTLCGGSS